MPAPNSEIANISVDLAAKGGDSVAFDRFRVVPSRRLLLEDGAPVAIGSRAFEVLIALLENPGDLVSKGELVRRIWPTTHVVEGNLTVHIAALRRILGDGHDGKRFIVNIPGRGYRFIAPVAPAPLPGDVGDRPVKPLRHNLPLRLTRLVGRDAVVEEIIEQLSHRRLVTVTGPGGIGKSSVANTVAELLVPNYRDGVWLADLSALASPESVAASVSDALNIEARAGDQLGSIVRLLRQKQLLLVLDNCDHVIDAAAAIAVALLKADPGIHVLATSREALGVEGEYVHKLSPLPCPPSDTTLTAEQALRFPAVDLFVERAAGTVGRYSLSDADAPFVAEICRKLDGIPLAIEFGAARLDAFGARALATHVSDHLSLLAGHHRSAAARHQTMQGALDWSYELLTSEHQQTFRRLGILVGGFGLHAASAVADGSDFEGHRNVIDAVAQFVRKSLLTVEIDAPEPQYRLLEPTRIFALQKLEESGEMPATARRHAQFLLDLFHGAESGDARGDYSNITDSELANLRAALGWAFAPGGDPRLGITLAAESAPVWLKRSRFSEFQVWAGKALASAEAAELEQRHSAMLHTAFGMALLLTVGMTSDARKALEKALSIVQADPSSHFHSLILRALTLDRLLACDFRGAAALVEQCDSLVPQSHDPEAQPATDLLAGGVMFFLGEFRSSRTRLTRSAQIPVTAPDPWDFARFSTSRRATAKSFLANILWLQGYPDMAVRTGMAAVAEAQALGDPDSICLASKWGGCTVALWVGDVNAAEKHHTILTDYAEKFGLAGFYPHVRALAGQIAIMRGDLSGVETLRLALESARGARNQMTIVHLIATNALGMLGLAEVGEAHAAIDEALDRIARTDELWYLPEALRVKGEILRREGHATAAEETFGRALECSRRQGALSWELRIALNLAELLEEQGRDAEARALLDHIYGGFTEGFDTADLRRARLRLTRLNSVLAPRPQRPQARKRRLRS